MDLLNLKAKTSKQMKHIESLVVTQAIMLIYYGLGMGPWKMFAKTLSCMIKSWTHN